MFTTEKKNIHKDHRQRVRDSYLKTGIDAMADHNILELLLFYVYTPEGHQSDSA